MRLSQKARAILSRKALATPKKLGGLEHAEGIMRYYIWELQIKSVKGVRCKFKFKVYFKLNLFGRCNFNPNSALKLNCKFIM